MQKDSPGDQPSVDITEARASGQYTCQMLIRMISNVRFV